MWRRPPGCVLVLLMLASCGPHRERPTTVTHSPAPAACESFTGPADLSRLDEAEPLSTPVSQLVAEVRIPVARITGEFAKQVPTRLASGSRVDIGSPGRLSYTVSRGPFQVTLRGSTLHVGTSVSGHAELCKPLGPLGCVHYGECDPQAWADGSLDLRLQPDFTLPRSQVSVTVTRPCVLSPVGYDATPEIRRGAHQQAARAQAMIDGVLAQVRPAALQAIEQVPREAPLGVQRKAVVQLAEVVQGAPRMDADTLVLPLGVRGTVEVLPSGAKSEQTKAMPAARYDSELKAGAELVVPFVLEPTEFAVKLERTLAGSSPKETASPLRVLRAVPSSGGLVVVVAAPAPVCAELAIELALGVDAETGRIVLRKARPLGRESGAREVAKKLEGLLVEVPLSPDMVRSGAADSMVRLPGVELELRPGIASSRIASVAVVREGVALFLEVRGTPTVIVR